MDNKGRSHWKFYFIVALIAAGVVFVYGFQAKTENVESFLKQNGVQATFPNFNQVSTTVYTFPTITTTTMPFNTSLGGPIKVCSWNVPLDANHLNNPEIAKEIAAKMSLCDVIAVQGVDSLNEMADPGCPRNANPDSLSLNLVRSKLELYLNTALGKNYGILISPQIRDKRYAFVYDRNTITLMNSWLYEDGDSKPVCDLNQADVGKMVYNPYVATFKDNAGTMGFTMINVLVDNQYTIRELENLYGIAQNISQANPNVIIAGTLYSSSPFITQNTPLNLRTYTWVNDPISYDQILLSTDANRLYNGSMGLIPVHSYTSPNSILWTGLKAN
jgi:hypothetical protein